MEVVKPTLEEQQQPKMLPQTLSREQKRIVDRVEAEAQETFQKLAAKFLLAFMDSNDPEGDEFKEVVNILDTKWRTYIKRRKLDPKASTALRLYIDDTLKEYQESKNEVK